MSDPSPRAGGSRFTLRSATAIRAQSDLLARQGKRRGRPRTRFLSELESRIALALPPTLGSVALASSAMAIVGLASGSAEGRAGAVPLALVAVVLSFLVVVAVWARGKGLPMTASVHAVSLAVTAAGVGASLRLMRSPLPGAPSHAVLLVPLFVSLLAIPPVPRTLAWLPALTIGVGVGAAGAIAPVDLIAAVLVAGVTFAVSRSRHRAAVAAFLRDERRAAALGRFRKMQDELVIVEKLEALRVLVGGMAHELNNALAVATASNQQATRAAEGREPLAGALRRSDGGLLRIKRTVDRLRKFAMAEDGVLEAVDVKAMVDFALESAIGRARSGVIVEREYEDDLGALECHVAGLAEALFQVARNAVESMPRGGTIRARIRVERRAGSAHGDRVVLSVKDEGAGMSKEQLARMFDPFYTKHGASRSGLGLSAVYGLVTALGGNVEVSSEEGKGTEVSIALGRKPSKQG